MKVKTTVKYLSGDNVISIEDLYEALKGRIPEQNFIYGGKTKKCDCGICLLCQTHFVAVQHKSC